MPIFHVGRVGIEMIEKILSGPSMGKGRHVAGGDAIQDAFDEEHKARIEVLSKFGTVALGLDHYGPEIDGWCNANRSNCIDADSPQFRMMSKDFTEEALRGVVDLRLDDLTVEPMACLIGFVSEMEISESQRLLHRKA